MRFIDLMRIMVVCDKEEKKQPENARTVQKIKNNIMTEWLMNIITKEGVK